MAGVESLVVEEKAQPTKVVDREKVNTENSLNVLPVRNILGKFFFFIDMSTFIAGFLFDGPSSFAARVYAW